MKKILLGTVLTLLAIAIVAYLSLQYFLGSAVKTAVNNFAPRITQTKVELAGAKISAFSGVGTLTGLTVANPTGWSPANALSVGRIHVDMEPFSVFDEHILINEITIEQPEFLYETKLVASNVGDLMKNIQAATGPSGGAKSGSGKSIRMEVRKFTLRDGKVTISIPGAATAALPMPPVILENVGTGTGGVTPEEFSLIVMGAVTKQVVAVGMQAVTQRGIGGDAVKKAGDVLQGILGGDRTK